VARPGCTGYTTPQSRRDSRAEPAGLRRGRRDRP